MSEVHWPLHRPTPLIPGLECIVFTWDYHSSISFWSGLRVQPILADEVQTFKALITVHKVIQEGHPNVRLCRILVGHRQPSALDHQGSSESSIMAGDILAYRRR